MDHAAQLLQEYDGLMSSQYFSEPDLDYARLEAHIPFLDHLSRVDNSSVSVFDLYRREHVYYSAQFAGVLGYGSADVEADGERFIEKRAHPEDHRELMRNGIAMLRFCFGLGPERRKDFKLVNDFRLRAASGAYVRVIEQHQALELDDDGNLWLALSVMDISPDSDVSVGIKSRLVNFRTGELYDVPLYGLERKAGVALSSREREVLTLVREGLMSKEIADRLYLSVHTVNTHRQRILEKLNASNSLEAIRYAGELGLLG